MNKGRVHDYYVCEGNTLLLDKTVFVSYGAGIMEPLEIDTAEFHVTDEGYEITGIGRRLDTLVMAVGLFAEHTIEAGGKTLLLKDVFGTQKRVSIAVRQASIADYWLSILSNGRIL